MLLTKFRAFLLITLTHCLIALLVWQFIPPAASPELEELKERIDEKNAQEKTIFLVVLPHPDQSFLLDGSATSQNGSNNSKIPGEKAAESGQNKIGFFTNSIDELSESIGEIPLISKINSIVLMIGMKNDDELPENDLKQLLAKIPDEPALFLIAIPPVDSRVQKKFSNQMVIRNNQKFKALCSVKVNCTFLDLNSQVSDETGNLRTSFHVGDGISFNKAAAQIWNQALKSLIP